MYEDLLIKEHPIEKEFSILDDSISKNSDFIDRRLRDKYQIIGWLV